MAVPDKVGENVCSCVCVLSIRKGEEVRKIKSSCAVVGMLPYMSSAGS